MSDDFRSWHRSPPVLVLPNAWDVESARVLAALPDCRALATSSAAVARSLGWEDGEQIPRDEMLAAVERIVRAVEVPVTADLEGGYGDPAATARAAYELGAAGMNLEDANRPVEEAVARVRATREAAPFVLNARVDTRDLDEAIARGNAYLAAGADCVYPIFIGLEHAQRLAREIDGPVNVMWRPGAPSARELEGVGVARITFGSGLAKVALDAAADAAAKMLV